MVSMFRQATSFNGDILKWDVWSVKGISFIFFAETSFTQKLCTTAWVHSEATSTSQLGLGSWVGKQQSGVRADGL